MCYCRHCETTFRAATGFDLPATADPREPARRAHLRWREDRLFSLISLWDGEVRRINPNARFIANSGGGASSPLNMARLARSSAILFADRQARSGTRPPWTNGKSAKEYRAAMGTKPVGGIFSVGVEEAYRWKDSVQSGPEIQLWAADGIANGLRPWFAKFNGKPIDRRWLRPVEDLYSWHFRHESYLRNTRPLTSVGLVYSQQTARYYGGERGGVLAEEHIDGFYQALIEARIPFEMVHEDLLDESSLQPFRTLILPNIAALSDTQCRQLIAFVRRGGNLVATHETSLYDEWGLRRPDFGLSEILGCSFAGSVVPRMQNAYLTLRHPHPLLRGLEDAPRIIHAVSRVEVRSPESASAPLTLVPSYPDLPMEDVYARVPETRTPQVFLGQFPGRVVYFPFDLDRTFWSILHRDHALLLRNAVEFAHGEPMPVTVTGPGLLDVTIWRQARSLTVHLVNLTNPMAMRGSYREVIPLARLGVQVRLPADFRPRAARTLVSPASHPLRSTNGALQFDLTNIGLHEVLAIDQA
jgi:hypothetical protein